MSPFVAPRSKILFDQRVGIGLMTINQLMAIATLVVVALVCHDVRESLRLVKANKISGNASSGDSTASSTSIPASTSVAGYACAIPDSYRNLRSFGTYITLGSELLAGEQWLQTLSSKLGRQPQLIQAAGRFSGNLTQQVAWVRQQTAYDQLVAGHQGALVFVSASFEWLLANPALSLDLLRLDWSSLFDANEPLVPPQSRAAFPVMLLVPPNPAYGGVTLDPAVARCSPPYQLLNTGSQYQWSQLLTAKHVLHDLYRQTVSRFGLALIDLDAALGSYSLALAPTAQQSVFATTCRTYTPAGQLMLADVVAACVRRELYFPGA